MSIEHKLKLVIYVLISTIHDDSHSAEDRLADVAHRIYPLGRQLGLTDLEIREAQGLASWQSAPALRICVRNEPVQRSTLDAAERALCHQIPKDYRSFLLHESNGGTVEPEPLSDSGVLLNVLLGVGLSEEWMDLAAQIHAHKDLVPRDFLPIGVNDFGDMLCLSLRKEDEGAVWLWDHELGYGQAEGDPAALTLIAASFRDFQDGKYPRPTFWDE